MRKCFLEKLPDFNRCEDSRIVTKDYHFELVTPMFGGDSESWQINLSAPVRAQSVKGQLRFWWRTMQSETDFARLLEKENSLWGGKTGKEIIQSRVKIAVMDQLVAKKHPAELDERGQFLKDDIIPKYVAFPITSEIKNGQKEVYYISELSFVLRMSFPEKYKDEVIKTLKLWTLFGGVGARTRRGCGSLYCADLMQSFSNEKDIVSFINEFGKDKNQLKYARISGAVFASASEGSDAASAWSNMLRSYSGFRQDRRPTKPTPGRSYWPEPDAIRILTGQKSRLHNPEHPDGVWFPRAAFGLPILSKFNTRGNGAGDPDPQVELQPDINTGERWPSPVILKAIRLSDGKILKTALVLNQSFPEKLVLKQRGKISVPDDAHPFSKGVRARVMKTRDGKQLGENETIYQAMFRELNLKEVK